MNSVNNGPYGDAVVQEMIPFLEKHFRIITQAVCAAARGRVDERMAVARDAAAASGVLRRRVDLPARSDRLHALPDDEHLHGLERVPRADRPVHEHRALLPAHDRRPRTFISTRELSRFEAVLGSQGRSAYQLEAWEAVYGPIGADGYPVPLWDKLTGKIDHNVANYMRDHGFDLRAYAEKNVADDWLAARRQAALLGRRHGRLLAQSRRLQVRGFSQDDARIRTTRATSSTGVR